jgi:hypothetical protein
VSQPPTNPAPVLNYLGPSTAQRHASGGLMLMGMAILGFGLLSVAGTAFDGSSLYRDLVALAVDGAVLAWGTFYMISGVTIWRGNTSLAPWALAVVILQTVLIAFGSIALVVKAFEDDRVTGFIATCCTIVVNVGFGSVIFELRKVIREGRFTTTKSTVPGPVNKVDIP